LPITRNRITGYRCANNKPGDDHPTVRWREADVENAVVAELESLQMPTPETGHWFRDTLDQAFGRLRGDQNQQKRILGRKKVELQKQNERLLSLYLEGHLDAGTYQDRSTALLGQIRELENGLSACGDLDPACRDLAIRVFDFTQRAVEVWRGLGMTGKQRIVRAISLNRTLSDVTLCLEKRKPFSLLAERLPVRTSRSDWTRLELFAAGATGLPPRVADALLAA
jgi:hypothetical protein